MSAVRTEICAGAHFAGVRGILLDDNVPVAQVEIVNPHWDDQDSPHFTGEQRMMTVCLTGGTAYDLRDECERVYRRECVGYKLVEDRMQ